MEKKIKLKLIGNTIFFNFIKTLDDNVKSFKDVKIKRDKNMVIFLIEPENSQKEKEYHSVDKIFRFVDNNCYFEYGCINLDFSAHWQEFFENEHNLEF